MAKYLSEEDMNTGEYISRDEILKAIHSYCENCNNCKGVMCRACDNADNMDIIIDMPAADVQPVKCGEWKWNEKPIFGNPYGCYICSECGAQADYKENYCCECGAKMATE